ncbi:MAG: phosphopantetheine-binding protein [Pseudomonadota bacterium]
MVNTRPDVSNDSDNVFASVCGILGDVLQLGDERTSFEPGTVLFGSIPEFDSMTVVTVLTMIEDEFDIVIHDDEVSADVFQTVGSLADFVAAKVTR